MTGEMADPQAQTLCETLEDPEIERLLTSAPKRPVAAKLLVGMQVLLALVSIPPGIMLLTDPNGSSLGMQFVLPLLVQALPFIHNFVPVGIWLITMYGVLPTILALGVWRSKHWAWYGSMFLGATVVTWIGVELLLFYSLGFTFWYPVVAGIGLIVLALSPRSNVRRSLQR
jgi:hypothetical protein